MIESPQFPIGPMNVDEAEVILHKVELIRQLEEAPLLLRQALEGMTDNQLDTAYKNWTIRQIANHLADSHSYGYVRFKFVLTDDQHKATPYNQNAWASLPDVTTGDLEPAVNLLTSLHQRWGRQMRSMTDDQFRRTYVHTDGKPQSLARLLGIYAWHGRHHVGQIVWMRENRFR